MQLLALAQVIVSIIVAQANDVDHGGRKSMAFAATWSMLVAILFVITGSKVIFAGDRSAAFLVGFLIGAAGMMAELFFVLMVLFYTSGEEATSAGYGESLPVPAASASADLLCLSQPLLLATRHTPALHCSTACCTC